LLFSSNGKQTFRNWIQNQHEFAEVMDARLITYDCGHYIHYFKSKEMSKEIIGFIDSISVR
ncbi:MAG: alpha/beta hydrolase, partial [Eubacterium sp.]|nr:alpha/beta hydrolase [Eubacterium sp.]